MELLPHLLEHAFEDTIYLVPFLLATYILLELLEHKAGDKAAVLVRKAGIAGPFAGSLLGAVPQCGFSAAGSALYASRAITLGTLFAVFLSTSDEMLPLFIAEQVDPLIMLSIIGTKIAIGMIMGFAIDGALRLRVRSEVKHEEKRLRDLGHGVCCTHTSMNTDVSAIANINPTTSTIMGMGSTMSMATRTNTRISMSMGSTTTMDMSAKPELPAPMSIPSPAPIHTIIPFLAPVPMVITSPGQSSNSPFPIITATIPAAAFPKNQAAGKIS